MATAHFGFFHDPETFHRVEASRRVVQCEWVRDCGDIVITQPLYFTDRHGKLWETPAGYRCNGLSVPRFFWRICDPYAGRYREGSVLHDHACEFKTADSEIVHEMLYDAWRANGGHSVKSWLMYLMVKWFGPQFCKEGH